jgi:hypothetical protein
MSATKTRDIEEQALHPAYSNLTAQTSSSWLTRSQAGQLLPSFVAKRARSNAQIELNIQSSQLCPNKVNEEKCWTVIADATLHAQLSLRVAALLKSSSDQLYKRERRMLSTYFELYLVGPNEPEARPTIVISCTSKEDYKRVKGLIKKIGGLMDFPSVNLAATIGSPRSSRALEPLAAGDENAAAIEGVRDIRNGEKRDAARSGDRVFVSSRKTKIRDLALPATVWIGGDGKPLHKAVLGGLLTTEDGSKFFGLTVAHAFEHHKSDIYGDETPARIDAQDSPDAAGKPKENNSATELMSPGSARSDREAKVTIGRISNTSTEAADHDLDWALVELKESYNVLIPTDQPNTVASIPSFPTPIKLLRPRGDTRGTLSPSPTYIRVHDGADFVPAWAVTIDGTISKSPFRLGFALCAADY